MLLFSCGACSGDPQRQPKNLTGDQPKLSSGEAIGMVRQHSMLSNISPGEERAAEQIRRLETGLNTSITWEASYRGSGKWSVTLNIPPVNSDNGFNYQWTVFEQQLVVIFVEEIRFTPNINN